MQNMNAQGPTPFKSLSAPFLALSFLVDTELYQILVSNVLEQQQSLDLMHNQLLTSVWHDP